MFRPKRVGTALAVLTATALAPFAQGVTAGALDTAAVPPPPVAVSAPDVGVAVINGVQRTVAVGDVIATGTMQADGTCNFPWVIQIGAVNVTAGYNMRVRTTDACELLVIISRPLPDVGDVSTVDDFVSDPYVGVPVGVDEEGEEPLLPTLDPCGTGSTSDCSEPRTWIKHGVEVKHTILEQFNITAYERIINFHYEQNTYDGYLRALSLRGSRCYVSSFPGNYYENCTGRVNKWSGSYIETQRWADFDNKYIGPSMYVVDRAVVTATGGLSGYCDVVEGNFPPFWEDDCNMSYLY